LNDRGIGFCRQEQDNIFHPTAHKLALLPYKSSIQRVMHTAGNYTNAVPLGNTSVSPSFHIHCKPPKFVDGY